MTKVNASMYIDGQYIVVKGMGLPQYNMTPIWLTPDGSPAYHLEDLAQVSMPRAIMVEGEGMIRLHD